VAAVATGEAFALFPLVPPPRPEASRFEGLFWPGSYTIQLLERSAGETVESNWYRTTVLRPLMGFGAPCGAAIRGSGSE